MYPDSFAGRDQSQPREEAGPWFLPHVFAARLKPSHPFLEVSECQACGSTSVSVQVWGVRAGGDGLMGSMCFWRGQLPCALVVL